MTTEMELVVGCDGSVECIYDEALDLREIGRLQITRASHVERDAAGFSWADMGPVDGPVLGPFRSRMEAVAAERVWLPVGLSEREASSPETLDEPQSHQKQHCTKRGNENGPQQTLAKGYAKRLHKPTAEQPTQHAHNDIPDRPVAAALHDHTREQASHEADHDKPDDCHGTLLWIERP